MGLREILQTELEKLKETDRQLANELANAPAGALRISISNGCVQYYHRLPGETGRNGKYIKKKDSDLACRLAQAEYNEVVLNLIEKRIFQLEEIIEDYADDEIEKLYDSLSAERQKLITPVTPIREQFISDWLAKPYIPKPFEPGSREIYTEKGLRVRSKSEQRIAEYLDSHNIPYKYECPLLLQGYGLVYPDFTVLSKNSLKEMYWEHEGMMDDPSYAEAAVKKINLYEKNGIYIGERLILTFETSQIVINSSEIARTVNRYLLQ